jgi:hypothetical protein
MNMCQKCGTIPSKGVRHICKPRVRFCFECGRKLRGNHFIEAEVDGHKRIFHKSCIEVMK